MVHWVPFIVFIIVLHVFSGPFYFIILSLSKNYRTENLQKIKQASQKHTMLQRRWQGNSQLREPITAIIIL